MDGRCPDASGAVARAAAIRRRKLTDWHGDCRGHTIMKRKRRKKTMAERVTADQLLDDLTAIVRDAENLLRATAAQGGEKVDEVRAKAEESLRQAKERLKGVEEEALAKARAIAGDADEYVRDNPWQAVGIAAGIGLVIGLLMARR